MLNHSRIPALLFLLTILIFIPTFQKNWQIEWLTFLDIQKPQDGFYAWMQNPVVNSLSNHFSQKVQPVILMPIPTPIDVQGCSGCDDIEKERVSMLLTATAKDSVALSPVPTPTTPSAKVIIYFFWGDGCPHCAKAKPFFDQLANSNPQIDLRMYEVWNDPQNQEIFVKMGAVYGMTARYVPTYFIGNQYWEGYNDTLNAQIRTVVNKCLVEGCPDYGSAILQGKEPVTMVTPTPVQTATPLFITTTPAVQKTLISRPQEQPTPLPTSAPTQPSQNVLDVPGLGIIDLSKSSLFLSTLIIAFVDGFNPCSIWVLSVLLAITLHSGSRKKVIIIGLVFISVTALIYALFIAGLFTIFTYIQYVVWIQVAVAGVALLFGLINIKDYFWYRQGLSFTINDQQKNSLYHRMRNLLLKGDSILGLIVGTVVLAGGVSLIEFSCTAGFPILWTNIVSAQQVSWISFIFLLLVYMIVYQADELGLFFIAVTTLRAAKITEKHGRTLKLVGGVLMLSLAVVMLVNPRMMNSFSGSLFVFGIAFLVSIGILVLHQKIIPSIKFRNKTN